MKTDSKGPVWFDEPAVCPQPPAPALAGPWKVLGIQPTADQRAVKRAYAQALRAMGGAEGGDPVAFQALRDAYGLALQGPQPQTDRNYDAVEWEAVLRPDRNYYQVFIDLIGGKGPPPQSAEPPHVWREATYKLWAELTKHLQGYAGSRGGPETLAAMREDIARLCYMHKREGRWPSNGPMPVFELLVSPDGPGVQLVCIDPRTGQTV